jgi:hypothetical protein
VLPMAIDYGHLAAEFGGGQLESEL